MTINWAPVEKQTIFNYSNISYTIDINNCLLSTSMICYNDLNGINTFDTIKPIW